MEPIQIHYPKLDQNSNVSGKLKRLFFRATILNDRQNFDFLFIINFVCHTSRAL